MNIPLIMFINLSWNFQRIKNKIWKRWLFHATDFQSLMYPCFTFSSILGIFPYKINASIFEASKWRYILLTIISCAHCIYALARIYQINMERHFRITLPEKIQDHFYNVLECFIIIVSSILCGPRMRLLQTILEVSSKLPSESYKKLSKLIHIKDIFGFFFLIGLSLISYSSFSKNMKKYEKEEGNVIFSYIINLWENSIAFQIFLMNMLYINCVCILKACFKRIDDNLTNLRELMINDKHLPRLIYYQQRNSLLLRELKTLEKQYLMISDTVQMLNIIFSPQLLATFGIFFIEITFEIYLNMVQWQNGISVNLTKSVHSIFFILYILYQITKMTLIVWACETGKNQAMKISTTLHDVLNSTSDEQIKNEV